MIPLLWLCGPSGVGKSSVGWEIFTRIRARGILEQARELRLFAPAPS